MNDKVEKELKIFSGKGNIKNTIISDGSNLNREDSINNNNENPTQTEQNNTMKKKKKRIQKEISLKQVNSKVKLNLFKRKSNSPKKNTLSINGNVSRNNNNRPSMADRSSFFEKNFAIGSSNSHRYSYVGGYEQNKVKI